MLRDKIHSLGQDGQGNTIYMFYCPACECGHPFHVPAWQWNGSLAVPTFFPSLKCFIANDKVCHCLVTNGKIRFLDDCWHALKGQTIDLPEWPVS